MRVHLAPFAADARPHVADGYAPAVPSVRALPAVTAAITLATGLGAGTAAARPVTSRSAAIRLAAYLEVEPRDAPGYREVPGSRAGFAGGDSQGKRCAGLAPQRDELAAISAAPISEEGKSYPQIGSTVEILRSPALAHGDIVALSRQQAIGCARATVLRQLQGPTPAGLTLSVKVSASRLPSPVPGAVGIRLIIDATETVGSVSMEPVTQVSDLVFFARGQALVGVTFSGSPEPFPAALEQHVLSSLIARAKRLMP